MRWLVIDGLFIFRGFMIYIGGGIFFFSGFMISVGGGIFFLGVL